LDFSGNKEIFFRKGSHYPRLKSRAIARERSISKGFVAFPSRKNLYLNLEKMSRANLKIFGKKFFRGEKNLSFKKMLW